MDCERLVSLPSKRMGDWSMAVHTKWVSRANIFIRASARAVTVCALFGLAACDGASDGADLSGSSQAVRQRVNDDFFDNPSLARSRYAPLFVGANGAGRNKVIAKIVACGQLEANGLPLYEGCRSLVNKAIVDVDPLTRSVAMSSLAFRNDPESIELLLNGYDEKNDEVHMAAANAIQVRLDSLKGTNRKEGLVELGRQVVAHCNAELNSSIGQKLCADATFWSSQ